MEKSKIEEQLKKEINFDIATINEVLRIEKASVEKKKGEKNYEYTVCYSEGYQFGLNQIKSMLERLSDKMDELFNEQKSNNRF